MSSVLEENSYVAVQKVGGDQVRVCRLQRKQHTLIEKLRFAVDGALGKRPGLFEVRSGQLHPADVDTLVAQDGKGDIELNSASTSVAIVSTIATEQLVETIETLAENGDGSHTEAVPRKRQRITQEQIFDMKTAAVGPGELVNHLIAGNAAFTDRTVYSKEKYIRRKTRKHTDRVLILQPTIRLLCDAYYRKDPEKMSLLRIDQLGLLLSLGNIYAGCRAMVLEQCQGLLTAAVLDRFRGHGNGKCIHLHKDTIAQGIPCLYAMNFNEQTLSQWSTLQISTVLNGGLLAKNTEHIVNKTGTVNKGDVGDEDIIEEGGVDKASARLAREAETWRDLNDKPVDTVLIAVRTIDVSETLRYLTPHLRLAGTLVVYTPNRESLIDGYNWMKESGTFINVSLMDSFFRQHQVLPDRTHPLMQQNVAGGFVLSGIKIQPENEATK